MVGVVVREGETIDIALRRFKRECINSGIQSEFKRHEFYEKPSERKKRKKQAAARKRHRRKFLTGEKDFYKPSSPNNIKSKSLRDKNLQAKNIQDTSPQNKSPQDKSLLHRQDTSPQNKSPQDKSLLHRQDTSPQNKSPQDKSLLHRQDASSQNKSPQDKSLLHRQDASPQNKSPQDKSLLHRQDTSPQNKSSQDKSLLHRQDTSPQNKSPQDKSLLHRQDTSPQNKSSQDKSLLHRQDTSPQNKSPQDKNLHHRKLQHKIEDELRRALKQSSTSEQATVRLSTLRLLKSDLQYEMNKTGRKDLADKEVESIIKRAVKQRREAIQKYQEANRNDLLEKEQAELAILEEYLPPPLSETELYELIEKVWEQVKPSGKQDLGKLMGSVMQEEDGRNIDATQVRQLLTKKLETLA